MSNVHVHNQDIHDMDTTADLHTASNAAAACLLCAEGTSAIAEAQR